MGATMAMRPGSGSLSSDQYLRIRGDILAGEFPDGSRLLETSLAARYGVSRTPVREALVALLADGLIERVDNGFRVRTGTPEDVIDIYEARIALEAVAASAAARRHTDLDLARLKNAHTDALAKAAAGDDRGAHEADANWHEALWQAAHNATINQALGRWLAQLRIYDAGPPGPSDDLNTTWSEHEAILAAIESGDADAAHAAMTMHLEHSRQKRLGALG
jgi:DNA-binding GntR family transcriptional regulator